jgi:ABC-type lipoprotein release transport system permease subunit
MLGYRIHFSVEPWLVFGCFSLALAIVAAASWFPAKRAAGLDLLEALKYE